AADFPDDLLNFLAVANALAGFQYVHIFGYADVDLENDEKLTWVDGNTTYVLIRRENIPLLEPLRILGLTELADSLNAPLKAIIDKAYNRDYPGLVETA
ncbi:PE-PPE domain-containing protein, partial [Mycobacterium sp. ITM-2017-0098]